MGVIKILIVLVITLFILTKTCEEQSTKDENDLQLIQGLVGLQPEQKVGDEVDKITDENEDVYTSYEYDNPLDSVADRILKKMDDAYNQQLADIEKKKQDVDNAKETVTGKMHVKIPEDVTTEELKEIENALAKTIAAELNCNPEQIDVMVMVDLETDVATFVVKTNDPTLVEEMQKRVKEIEIIELYKMNDDVEVKNKSSDKWKDGVVMSPGRLFAQNPFLKVKVSSCCGLVSKPKHFKFIRKKGSKYRSPKQTLHLASLKEDMETAKLLSDTLIKNKNVVKQVTDYLKALMQFHEDTKKAIGNLDADFLDGSMVKINLMWLEERNTKILAICQNSFELQDPFKSGTTQEKLQEKAIKYLLRKNYKKLSNLKKAKKYQKIKGSSSCNGCSHFPDLYEIWTNLF